MKNKTALWLWFLLSWGIIVATEYPDLNQLVLKGLIPVIFATIYISEGQIYLKNRALNFYIYFFFWCCLSIFYSVNQSMTFKYLQTMLGIIVLWYCVYRLIFHIKNNNHLLLIIGGTFVFHAVVGVITPVEIIAKVNYSRATGAFTNANALGFSMWYGVVIFSFFLLNNKLKTYRFFIFIAITLFTWVLLTSGSRKNAFALAVFFAILVYYLIKGKLRWSFIIVFIIGYFAYDFALSNTAVGARLQGDSLQRGVTNRGELISEGFSFFLKYPLLGIALGSFTSFSSSGMMAHNDYIEILSSTGIIGLLIYLPIFYSFFKTTRRLLRDPNTFELGVVARGFLIGYILLGMGRPSFLDPVAMLVFGFFQSLILKESIKMKLSKNKQQEEIKQYAYLPDHQHA